MPSVAVYGDSGMGKTMIMERFRDDNPPGFDPGTGRERAPVLAMEMVGKPGERRFYAELLALLGAPQSPRADIVQMEQAALRLLKAVGVQVLVIDEVHNLLAGSHRDQRVVLNTLRFLSNRLQISLVCFGVTDAREAISGDVQLARRFEEFSISRWAANEQFETLVSSILRNTLLRKPTVLTPRSSNSAVTRASPPTSFHMTTASPLTPPKADKSELPTRWSITVSTARRLTREFPRWRQKAAARRSAGCRRTLVVVDCPARRVLQCLASGDAAPCRPEHTLPQRC